MFEKELLDAIEAAKLASVEIVKIYKIENVSIIDKAVEVKTPYNMHLAKEMAIYGLVGLVISCGLIFVLFYFDTTVNYRWGANAHVTGDDFDFAAALNKMMDVLDQKVKKDKDKVQEKK